MWAKWAARLAARLAVTEDGRKLLKGILIGIVCFFLFIPVIVFLPIAGLVVGIGNFFAGDEGEDLNDLEDLDALLNGTYVITESKFYKQVDKGRTKHIEKIETEQKEKAEQVKEENKYTETYTYTDSEGNEHERTRTVYPEVQTPAPDPPMVSVLAYFCTCKDVQITNSNHKISNQDIQDFYQKICKPFKVEKKSKDLYIVSVEYMTDDEIAELLYTEEIFEDEADEDLYRVSIERLTTMIEESGGYAYGGTPSGNISDTSTAKIIWDYYKGAGWSDYACAAIIGNFEAECSLKPNLEETGGTGIGLGQWSFGRRTNFLNWLHRNNKDIRNIQAQCEYVIVENVWYAGTKTLYNGGGRKHTSKANSLAEFGTYDYASLADAVDDFLWHWESPNYQYAQQDRWQGAAQDAYNMFAGGGSPIYSGSYAQIKQSFFPGGRLPMTEAEARNYCTNIAFVNSAGVKKYVSVHKSLAADLLEALTRISEGGYEVKEIGGFAWKTKTNSSSGERSSHSYGLAIDINWNYGNPQVKNGKVLVGTPYGSHELSLKAGDLTVNTLKAYGWKWGGNWRSSKDYMHFSIPGD